MRSPWIIQVALNTVTSVLIRHMRDRNAEEKSRKDRAEPEVASSPRTPGAHSSWERQGCALRPLDFGPLAPELGADKPVVVGPRV